VAKQQRNAEEKRQAARKERQEERSVLAEGTALTLASRERGGKTGGSSEIS